MIFFNDIRLLTENFQNLEAFDEIEVQKLKLLKVLTQFFKEYPNLVFFDISESIYDDFITIEPISIKGEENQLFSVYENKYFANLEVKKQIYKAMEDDKIDLEIILDDLIEEAHKNPHSCIIINFSKIGSGCFYFDRNFSNEHFLEYLGSISGKLNIIKEKYQLDNLIDEKNYKYHTIKM